MPTTTIRLAHPELCDGCSSLLPTGTAVLVDPGLHVRCSHCAGSVVGHRAADPWAWIDDPSLRHRLQHRHDEIVVERRQLAFA
jgi:hypothetical protein